MSGKVIRLLDLINNSLQTIHNLLQFKKKVTNDIVLWLDLNMIPFNKRDKDQFAIEWIIIELKQRKLYTNVQAQVVSFAHLILSK